MSHIVTVKTEVRDAAAVRAACKRLGLTEPIHGAAKLFSGQAEGLIVQLPDWQYPIVCDIATGQVRYDNFGGRWGKQAHLDRFQQSPANRVPFRRKYAAWDFFGTSCSRLTAPAGSTAKAGHLLQNRCHRHIRFCRRTESPD